MEIKSILSPEGSIVAGIATMALVAGVYEAHLGPVADAHASEANDGNLNAALKKSGWEAIAAVGGVTLLARDPNILILGGAVIIAMELAYRHAIMTDTSGQIVMPTSGSYTPASQASDVVTGEVG